MSFLLFVNDVVECCSEFAHQEGLTLYLLELVWSEVVPFHAEPTCQLTHVLFCNHHLLVFLKHLGSVLGQRIDEFELSHRHLLACCTKFVHSRAEVTECAAKAYDEQVCIILVAQHLEVWHLNLVYLFLTQASHEVVVLWVCRDSTSLVVFLQTT